MKIVCFSINPGFSCRITAGASKHLIVCQYLAGQGHQVVLARRRKLLEDRSFRSGREDLVSQLPFHLPPQLRVMCARRLARLCELIARHQSATGSNIHDGEFSSFSTGDVPTSSHQGNFYPENPFPGSFINQADEKSRIQIFSSRACGASAGDMPEKEPTASQS